MRKLFERRPLLPPSLSLRGTNHVPSCPALALRRHRLRLWERDRSSPARAATAASCLRNKKDAYNHEVNDKFMTEIRINTNTTSIRVPKTADRLSLPAARSPDVCHRELGPKPLEASVMGRWDGGTPPISSIYDEAGSGPTSEKPAICSMQLIM